MATVHADRSPIDSKPEAGATPVVIDLGKRKRKQIKQIRRGQGRLMDEVHELLAELQTGGSVAPGAQPVIVVVQPKRRRRAWL